MEKRRCEWANDDALLADYHDNEYGFPVKEDNVIFERLMLEIYQAGLSWKLVLTKRKGFNDAFYNYDLTKVANMTDTELEKQRENPEIIRNKLKIQATRTNARTSRKLIDDYGSLQDYFRSLPHQVENDPKQDLKDAVKMMKNDGFKFIGPLILDEFFMSIGLNPVKHENFCFLHQS